MVVLRRRQAACHHFHRDEETQSFTTLFGFRHSGLFHHLAVAASAGHWPGWRGPDGNGISKEKDLPLRWSTNQNVRWRTPLPERCNSTPVVWGSRIFITQPIEKENRCTVMCFNQQDG